MEDDLKRQIDMLCTANAALCAQIDAIVYGRDGLRKALQTAHDHMHSMMLQMNEMQNVPHMKVLNELANYLVE